MNSENTNPVDVVAGDFDSIIFLGCDAQNKLRESSRMISNMILRNNEELELLLNQIVIEIDEFQKTCERKPLFNIMQANYRNRLIRNYNQVLVYIDQVTVALQLQEAQLLKDNKLFHEMQNQVKESTIELERIIESSTEWIRNHQNNDTYFLKDADDVSITTSWSERFSKRIQDLKISHTVANQTLIQLQIMCDNNNILIEKIISALSGTIPIWRNQVSLLLGVEKLNRNISLQKKITEMTDKYLKENDKRISKSFSKKKNCKGLDLKSIRMTNEQFNKIINELSQIEINDEQIRIKLGNVIS